MAEIPRIIPVSERKRRDKKHWETVDSAALEPAPYLGRKKGFFGIELVRLSKEQTTDPVNDYITILFAIQGLKQKLLPNSGFEHDIEEIVDEIERLTAARTEAYDRADSLQRAEILRQVELYGIGKSGEVGHEQ